MSSRVGNIINRIVLPQQGQWALRFTQGVLGAIALSAATYQVGWVVQPDFGQILISATAAALAAFAVLETLLWITHQDSRSYWSNNRFFIIASAALFVPAAIAYRSFSSADPEKTAFQVALLIGVQLTLGIAGLLRLVRFTHMRWFVQIHPGFIAAGSFAAAIALGTALLKTPKATFPGTDLSWIDALFQSASAVCVTGLITVDTEFTFTTTGQSMLLVLIQAGGLGIMTWAYLAAVVWGENLSLHDRILLKDIIKGRNEIGIKQRVMEIVLVTFAIEAIGFALLLYAWRSIPGSVSERCFTALFHSISGYCNAGFSTFSSNLADNRVRHESLGLAGIATLVIVGGLGMPVLANVAAKLKHWIRSFYRRPTENRTRVALDFHTRLALTSTAILLIGGTATLYLFREVQAEDQANQIWLDLFDSITARTAGFNIESIGSYAHSSAAVLMILMFIGGCPNGTAGGIKCTTFAIVLINLKQVLRQENSPRLWKRSIAGTVVFRSFAILTLSAAWIVCASILLQLLHPTLSFIDLSFETVSAFATVGLSRGITADLSNSGKLIIVATMFVGRLGILLLFASFLPPPKHSRIEYPVESPFVG